MRRGESIYGGIYKRKIGADGATRNEKHFKAYTEVLAALGGIISKLIKIKWVMRKVAQVQESMLHP